MFGLGTTEVIVILAIGLLLFGRNLPTLARSLGKSVVEFRNGLSDLKADLKNTLE